MPYEINANLMGYLPSYYHENEEMTRLTDAENPEIDALWEAVRETKYNQFIVTADEGRIRLWEKLLHIRPDYATQSLDYRKAVVIMRLSTRLPLTYRWLDEKLTETVETGNYVITLYHNDYALLVRLTNDLLGLTDELRRYFRRQIPANLTLSVDELLKTWREVHDRDYLLWGCTPVLRPWDETADGTWGEPNTNWYETAHKGKHGGVVSTQCWWTRLTWTWQTARGMAWLDVFTPNTWQDVRNYVWNEDDFVREA